VLSEVAGFAYKVTDYYAPKAERTILWSDPDLAIPWPVAEGDVIVSDKDRNGAPLQLAEVFS
jgi:dTDP-4-dehydrorhamnose 3,5-epimerase